MQLFTIKHVKQRVKARGVSFNGTLFHSFEADKKIPPSDHELNQWENGPQRAYSEERLNEVVEAYIKAFDERKNQIKDLRSEKAAA